MNDIHAPQHGHWKGARGRATQLVGRESEMDRLHALLATAGTGGAALVVPGEAGVGKAVLLDAASEKASAAGMGILRAAGVQFEADLRLPGGPEWICINTAHRTCR